MFTLLRRKLVVSPVGHWKPLHGVYNRMMNVAKGTLGFIGQQIVNQAMTVVSESGIEALSVRSLARLVSVSPQGPYKHFKNREHLVAEVVRRFFERFALALEGVPRTRNPHRDLKALGRAYLNYAREHPQEYRLMFGALLPAAKEHSEIAQSANRIFTVLQACVSRMHSSSGKKSAPDSSEVTTLFVWSVLHGVASLPQTEAGSSLSLLPATRAATAAQALKSIGSVLPCFVPQKSHQIAKIQPASASQRL